MHTHTNIYTHTYTYIIHTPQQKHICILIHTFYMLIPYIHTYIHTHIYTHTGI